MTSFIIPTMIFLRFKDKDPLVRSAIGNQITLAYEEFGNPKGVPLFLIMGAMNAGLFWPDSFCQKLAGNHYRVIRYDQRDTGGSTKIDYQATPYGLTDMANDLLLLANQLSCDEFHVVGLSLGGAVGQIVAADNQSRCKSLTLIGSTIDSRPYNAAMMGQDGQPGPLSTPASSLIEYARQASSNPPITAADAFESIIDGWRIFYGDRGFPEQSVRANAATALKLQHGSTSGINHAFAAGVEALRISYARRIVCPTLILHGTEDQAFPKDHALNSAKHIPHARLVWLDGVGHMPNETEFLEVSDQIEKYLRSMNSIP